jgi:peptide/nickel transport system substrate-binding protein
MTLDSAEAAQRTGRGRDDEVPPPLVERDASATLDASVAHRDAGARPTAGDRGSRPLRLIGVVAVLGLLTAACGGDDGGSAGAADDGGLGARTFEREDAGEPQHGGTIVYGIEADTSQPWTPAQSLCAISCHQVFTSVYDPLTMPDEDGIPQPNLLARFESNEAFTEWRLHPRSGITFHDGTPFDAEAIRVNLQDHLDSSLTSVALKSMERVSIASDRSHTIVTMNEPWRGFPYALTGQLGAMASPVWLQAVRAGAAQATEPVGTGPFTFDDYRVGDRFRASRNDDYWKRGPNGEDLPYADAIEYRILEEGSSRINALQSGQVNVAHTSSGSLVARLRSLAGRGTLATLESDEFGETSYIMLNVDDGPRSQANPALQDVDVRRALAMAVDRERIRDTVGAGVARVANGPFPPGTIGYLEDTGFPEHDPDEAKRLIEEYESEYGPVRLTFSTTSDPENLETNQVIQGFWREVGVDANLEQVEQGSYILDGAFGAFEAFTWRNHGGFDPDMQNVWWHSDSAAPQGEIATNFGRFTDEVIDRALETIRSSNDEDEVRAAAEALNRRFAEQVYNLWSTWTVWAWGHAPALHGIDAGALPDGSPTAFPSTDKIAHEVSQIWIQQ